MLDHLSVGASKMPLLGVFPCLCTSAFAARVCGSNNRREMSSQEEVRPQVFHLPVSTESSVEFKGGLHANGCCELAG